MGIKKKINLLVFTVIVSLFLMSTIFIFKRFENQLRTTMVDSLISSAKESAQSIDLIMSYQLDVLNRIANPADGQAVSLLQIAEEAHAVEQMGQTLFKHIQVYDASGNVYTNNIKGHVIDAGSVERALAGRRHISNISRCQFSEHNVIEIAVPVTRQDQVIGVMIAHLNALNITDMLRRDDYDHATYAYILDNSGRAVAHMDYDYVSDGLTVSQIESGSEVFSGLQQFYSESLLADSGSGSYYKGGNKMLVSYSRVKDTNWRVYYAIDESFMVDRLFNTRTIFYAIIVLSLLLGLLASSFIANRIAAPLIALSDKFKEAASGDLSVRSQYESNDEVGLLAKNFNHLMNKINQLTFYDPLTNLANSNILIQDINKKRRLLNDDINTLFLISIDRFTKINEVYGLAAGDQILVTISERLKYIAGAYLAIYKGRGDEFFLVGNNISVELTEQLAEQIVDEIQLPYLINGKAIILKVSLGLVRYETKRFAASQLINQATHANLLSKSDKTYKWHWYNENSHQNDKDRAELESKMFKAIQNDEFYLVYQPIFSLKEENIVEAEALIRWHNDDLGMISTERFISLAEENGYIKQIDKWVFQSVCEHVSNWQSKVKLSVNISALTFEDDDFVYFVRQTLDNYQIDPSLIQIELTERVILNSPTESIEKMQALSDLGIHVALDDFGVGYSSLGYLVKLPINLVKIDRSFIRSVSSNIQSSAIVSAIINMCHDIGLTVLAEGVENVAEVNYLKEKNCALVQGYYYSRPIELEAFERLYMLKQSNPEVCNA